MQFRFPGVGKTIEEQRGGATSSRNTNFGHAEMSSGPPSEEFEMARVYKILELKENVQDGDVNEIINM